MLLNKLKQFHQQTMERYRDEENMEPWKNGRSSLQMQHTAAAICDKLNTNLRMEELRYGEQNVLL